MTDPRDRGSQSPGSDAPTRAFRRDPNEPLPPHLDPRGARPPRRREPEADVGWQPAGPPHERGRGRPPDQQPPGPPGRPPLRPPVHPGPDGKPPRRGRPWRRVLLVAGVVLVLYLAFLVVVPFIAWQNVNRVDASPDGSRPSDTPGTTYLLVGSDSREGLSDEEQRQLGTKNKVSGARTDTILMLHVTDSDGPDLLLSLPRDSIVDIPGHGRDKINSAYTVGGPKLLVQTVEKNTGVRVDDYVEIGLGGFVNVIDAVNGIEICPDRALKDKKASLDIKAGCQEADGATALGYARSRKLFAQGDIVRAQHQREVVNATADEVLSVPTFVLPWRYWDVWSSGADSLSVGDNVGVWDMQRFVRAMHGGGSKKCVVPIVDLAVHWDPVKAQKLFQQIRADDTGAIRCSARLGG